MLGGDVRFQPRGRIIRKKSVVELAEVNRPRLPRFDNLCGFKQICWDAEVDDQVVGGARRHDAERTDRFVREFRGARQPVDRVANRPVPARNDDGREPVARGLFSQVGHLSLALRDDRLKIHARGFERGLCFRPAHLRIPAI